MPPDTNSTPRRELPEQKIVEFEERLQKAARSFAYPTTPDIAAVVIQRLEKNRISRSPRRRLAAGLLVLLFALATALWASPARAQILDWLRIGSVKIFLPLSGSTPTVADSTGTQAPTIKPTFLESILDLAGETTLAHAQELADFPVALPDYPADLNDPEHVFVQQFSGPIVTLVWMDPSQPDRVRLALSQSRSEKAVFEKINPASLQETRVNDHPAIWVDSDYILITRLGDAVFARIIDQGQTLIWTDGEITYRLETEVDLETAIRIAESIH